MIRIHDEERTAMTDIRKLALSLYVPPFRHEKGYIFDSKNSVVSDNYDADECIASRVRGWGRISYLRDAEKLQDEFGDIIADSLNSYYAANK